MANKTDSYKLIDEEGKVHYEGTHLKCDIHLLKIQPYSTYFAKTYNGWKVIHEDDAN